MGTSLANEKTSSRNLDMVRFSRVEGTSDRKCEGLDSKDAARRKHRHCRTRRRLGQQRRGRNRHLDEICWGRSGNHTAVGEVARNCPRTIHKRRELSKSGALRELKRNHATEGGHRRRLRIRCHAHVVVHRCILRKRLKVTEMVSERHIR